MNPATLAPMDVASRLDNVRARFDGIDALLVTRLVNVRYLTGFTGSAAMLLVGRDGATFVTDGRYRDQSADQLAAAGVDAEISIGLTQAEQRDALAAYEGVKVELHLSNTAAREEWRRTSVVGPVVTGTVAGFGRTGYRLAVEAAATLLGERA